MSNVVRLRTYEGRHSADALATPISAVNHQNAESFLCSFSALSTHALPIISPLLLSRDRLPLRAIHYLTDPAVLLKLVSAGWAQIGRPPNSLDRHPDSYLQSLGLQYALNLVQDSPRFNTGPHSIVIDSLWASALFVGYLSLRLMQLSSADQADCRGAFFAGLCHDAGWLVQLKNKPRLVPTILDDINTESKLNSGSNHERLAQTLAYSWGLPRPYADVVSFHHQADIATWWKPDTDQSIFYTVAVAVVLAYDGSEKLASMISETQGKWYKRHHKKIQEILAEGLHIQSAASNQPELAIRMIEEHLLIK